MDLDKIKRYREEQKMKAEEDAKNKALLDAVNEGSNKTASVTKNSTDKLSSTMSSIDSTQKNVLEAMQSSQASVADALNNLVVATVMTKDPQLAETAKQLTDLLGSMSKASSDLKGSAINKLPAVNEKLSLAVDKLAQSISSDTDKDYTDILNDIKVALNNIEVSPVINVSPPNVTVPKLDLQPLIDVMSEKETETSVDLEDFRAQDLDGEEEGIQYIGFTSPTGEWMVIRNDIENNNLRYKFGKKDYTKAWPKFAAYQYLTLDKAINEIQA